MKKLFGLSVVLCVILSASLVFAGWGTVSGVAQQYNEANTGAQFLGTSAYASGSQGSQASYSGFLVGGASVNGSTVVVKDINPGFFSSNSYARANVQNEGIAGTLGTVNVNGAGSVEASTQAKMLFNNNALANTYGGAGFSYDNNGLLLTAGSGEATTTGYSQVNKISGGYSAFSTATSTSTAH